MWCANRKQDGFTLVELMITLVIAVILVMVAVPSFTGIIQQNRIAAKTNALVTFLATARSEAVKLGKPVTVCASTNGTACTGGSFKDGWIVFVDTGTAGTVDGTDRILNVQEKLGGGISVTFTPPPGGNYIQFAPTGMLSSACTQCEFDLAFPVLAVTDQSTGLISGLIAALSPWGIAHASGGSGAGGGGTYPGGSSGGSGGGAGGGGAGGGAGGGGPGGGGAGAGVPGPAFTYTLCDDRKKATGRSVQVSPTGRVSSQPYNGCPP